MPLPEPQDNGLNITGTLEGGQTARFLLYCSGKAGTAADGGYGCGGDCSVYHDGDEGLREGALYTPGTNCMDTDGTWRFSVCDGGSASCNDDSAFHPWQDKQGRWIYNTVGTMYIYPYG